MHRLRVDAAILQAAATDPPQVKKIQKKDRQSAPKKSKGNAKAKRQKVEKESSAYSLIQKALSGKVKECKNLCIDLLNEENASAKCQEKNSYKSLGTDEVSVSWWPKVIKRSKGITATIVSAGQEREDFPGNVPEWWDAFITATTGEGQKWEKGHLLGAQLGGPPKAYNLVPQHRGVNRGPIQACDNRIKEAIGCGCVKLRVEVNYGEQRKVAPISFTVTATGPGVNIVGANVVNTANPSTPSQCQK